MQNLRLPILICLLATLPCRASLFGQKNKTADPAVTWKAAAARELDAGYEQYKKTALQIWGFAETGFQEFKSAGLHEKNLSDNGFTVQAGVADMPTAFVASYGSGHPVIGILAEFDALPGLSQDSVVEKKSLGAEAGHGCGHHLFGTASVAAAIELKKIMEQNHLPGTIQVFGTPAEEGGSGKVYMVRAGLFSQVDVVLHWHPGFVNQVSYSNSLAVISAKFRFHGIAAHASMAPDKGRSALDAVEGMDYMVNMMREHIPSDARVHYIITNGGKAPNVVPDFAESYYVVRHADRETDRQLFDRIVKAAQGAALGSGTTMDYEIINGDYDVLPNRVLSVAMQKNLEWVGGVPYTETEKEFGKKIQATFNYPAPPIASSAQVMPLDETFQKGLASSDVGDVSWNVPTVGLDAATWVPGTNAHSWQAVACVATDIGMKGMMVAAKTMTLMGIDLLTKKELIPAAWKEFNAALGAGFHYSPLLGDRKPSLDYRK
jgi:aminobenzoyl-glutamate utilization protein B